MLAQKYKVIYMAGSTFGKAFQITTFGESHGLGVGVTIDGCPAGVSLDIEQMQRQLHRRRPGQSSITTQRKEKDDVKVLTGVLNGVTTGAPITLWIGNLDQRSHDYDHIKSVYRPSHADYTYSQKYGIRDHRGGGRSSARETAARVAAGSVAQSMLSTFGMTTTAYVSSVGQIQCTAPHSELDLSQVDENIVRCPDQAVAKMMIAQIEKVRDEGNTVGGVITCVIENVPVGLGEPVFDRLEADLAKAMLSINAVKGFEVGSGFNGASMYGSEHNDPFTLDENEQITTKSNYSGGVQGGISNGMPIYFRVAFKPTSTLMQSQQTIDSDGNETTMTGKGRHDPCVVPRAVPIVESMASIVIADHLMRSRTSKLSSIEQTL